MIRLSLRIVAEFIGSGRGWVAPPGVCFNQIGFALFRTQCCWAARSFASRTQTFPGLSPTQSSVLVVGGQHAVGTGGVVVASEALRTPG